MAETSIVASSGWPFVRVAHHLLEVDSTNNWAKRLLAEEQLGELPVLLWADRQTQGRGQGTNSWWSDEGSLTASVIFDPEAFGLAVGVRPRVALGAAAVAAGVVAELIPGCPVGVRWPNDIDLAGRKLGGILVEGVVDPRGPRLIVGFGLNVGTRLDQAPADVQRLAASLVDYGLNSGDRRVLLTAFLARLQPMLTALAQADPELVQDWARLDVLRGQQITVQSGAAQFTAIADGIEPTGGLRIQRDGRSEILFAGRILHVRQPG